MVCRCKIWDLYSLGLILCAAYAPRGTYAEWYWHAKDGDQSGKHQAAVGRANAINDFHNRVYGKDFEYKDFRDQFTCEMFEPTEWAKVFKRSGAKYVVLTSKHHDGYCLWPSKEASQSFGMAWNSVDSGPRRDLVGELTEAVRAEDGIKWGSITRFGIGLILIGRRLINRRRERKRERSDAKEIYSRGDEPAVQRDR